VNRTTHQKLARRKARIQKRLARRRWNSQTRPMLAAKNIFYGLADRARAIGCGGIGAVHLLATHMGLPQMIDRHVHVLKRHLPYHESDHVLSLAYNAMAGGLALRIWSGSAMTRHIWMRWVRSQSPDPTTAGDFCRRFENDQLIVRLMETINETRLARIIQAASPSDDSLVCCV
jgi:hypothetical protein